jgi:hypothetical protein
MSIWEFLCCDGERYLVSDTTRWTVSGPGAGSAILGRNEDGHCSIVYPVRALQNRLRKRRIVRAQTKGLAQPV